VKSQGALRDSGANGHAEHTNAAPRSTSLTRAQLSPTPGSTAKHFSRRGSDTRSAPPSGLPAPRKPDILTLQRQCINLGIILKTTIPAN
jgi:hypothetical protein